VRRDLLRGRGGIQRGKRGGGSIRETGVVRLMKVDCPATVALVFADNLEKGHGNQPPCTRDEGIASFVPVEIVLPADDVKEVALAEGQFLGVSVFGLVVVEGFDDLFRRKNGDGGFGGDGEMVVVGFGIFFPFKRPSDSLERTV
jgi:hypothetical protein